MGRGFRASMANGGEELGIEAGETGQVLGVGLVCLAGAAEDQPQRARVGDQDLMPELLEQVAGPAGVGASLHGYPAGREAGELASEGSFIGGDAGLFDEFALRVEDEDVGALVPQVQSDESRAILNHGRFLLLCTLSAFGLCPSYTMIPTSPIGG